MGNGVTYPFFNIGWYSGSGSQIKLNGEDYRQGIR